MTNKVIAKTVAPISPKMTQEEVLEQYTKALAAGIKKSPTAVQLGENVETDIPLINSWYEKASQCFSHEDVSKLTQDILSGYVHNSATIVHASSAIVLGTFSVIFASEQGAMTLDQRSELMWTNVRGLMGFEDEPLKLTRFVDVLIPGAATRMTTIPIKAWEWVQEYAKGALGDPSAVDEDPAVLEHLESIARGLVPEGITVSKD